MKLIDTSAILGSAVKMPIKAGHIEHLQNAHLDTVQQLLKSLAGLDPASSTVVVLSGAVDTGTHPVYTLSAGWVYYQGEMFEFPAYSETVGGTARVGRLITQYTATDSGSFSKADPVLFTDGNQRNVLNIRKIVIYDSAANATVAWPVGRKDIVDIDLFTNISYPFTWNFVGASGQPAFQNSWANIGSSDTSLSFRMGLSNSVKIRGNITNAGSTDQGIFTLPAGFRPLKIVGIPVTVTDTSALNPSAGFINILANGNVGMSGGALTNRRVYINSEFPID